MREFTCERNPDHFCYVCGLYGAIDKRVPFTETLENAYLHYFGFAVKNQDANWVPHMVCHSCRLKLYKWAAGDKVHFKFGQPMIWREPIDHKKDCYICLTEVKPKVRKRGEYDVVYPKVDTVTLPVPHSDQLPIPACPTTMKKCQSSTEEEKSSEEEFVPPNEQIKHLVTQPALNDLVRDLELSKRGGELLGSRLQQFGFLAPGVKVTYFRERNKPFERYFSKMNEITYCHNITGLFAELKHQYDPEEWRLFIDGSKYSLKAVLLHKGGEKPSVPIGYGINTKETYENLHTLLDLINYWDHEWKIVADLKVIAILTGLQGGFPKYCCFICEWDSRAYKHHYVRKEWPSRDTYAIGKASVANRPLVKKEKIILPPLHIKLGLMKCFVKALKNNSVAMQYLRDCFPRLSESKVKEGVFVGPQIRKLFLDETFVNHLTETQAEAWEAFQNVVYGFLGNNRSRFYVKLIDTLLDKFEQIGKRFRLVFEY